MQSRRAFLAAGLSIAVGAAGCSLREWRPAAFTGLFRSVESTPPS